VTVGGTAVILFNLGGPDSLESVRPFLRNLFRDRAIIDLPTIFRFPLAAVIAGRRAAVARDIYAKIGGSSPLLENTRAQASALAEVLGTGYSVHVAMRYWHPLIEETVAEVARLRPDRVVLLPLYPQFSSTTTASSVRRWRGVMALNRHVAPTHTVCCYPTEEGLISAMTELASAALDDVSSHGHPVRVLFSAHGLPKRVVAKGDPYPTQVALTAQAVVERLDRPDLDWVVCYQSRVGPLEWIGPSTESEIDRAGRDGRALVVVPLAFVSEHSETLVELDIEYAERASAAGVPAWRRVATVGTHPAFIAGLGHLVERALAAGPVVICGAAMERGG